MELKLSAKPLKESKAAKITFQKVVRLPVSSVKAYHHILGMDLSALFIKTPLLSGISGTAPYGTWERPGDKRIICFTDGTSATQTLTITVPGMLLSQEISGFNAAIGLLVERMDCRMVFMDCEDRRTTVTVDFEIIPKSAFAALIFKFLGSPHLEGYLQAAFSQIKIADDCGIFNNFKQKG